MRTNRLTPEEVAGLDGEAFLHLRNPRDCREWTFVPDYPASALWHWGTEADREELVESVREWWATQKEDRLVVQGDKALRVRGDKVYLEEFEADWIRNPAAFPPIVVAELDNGRLDIGDGWHRLAMAILHGPDRIPAFVGRACELRRKRRRAR